MGGGAQGGEEVLEEGRKGWMRGDCTGGESRCCRRGGGAGEMEEGWRRVGCAQGGEDVLEELSKC